MSIRVMSQVWECADLDKSETLVMLSLADHANDDGICYPSISRLCERTRMTDRGIQAVIKRLIERGFLTVQMNAGRSGSNLYTLHTTPEPCSPRSTFTPEAGSPQPPNPVHHTPEAGSPKPSGTINEPSEEEGRATRSQPKKVRLPEGWVPSDADVEYARNLNLTDAEIEEIADDFRSYWEERRDAKAKRTEDGWRRTWQGNCRRLAPEYIRNRKLAVRSQSSGYGRGGSVASAAARRRLAGQV